jgi:hypothetical protein
VHSGSPVRVTNKALTSNIATITTGTAVWWLAIRSLSLA